MADSSSSLDIQLIVENVGSLNAHKAVTAANKLLNIDKVDAALTMIIEEAHPIASLFVRARRPLMVVWDSSSQLSEMGDYIFSNGFSVEMSGKNMAHFAAHNLGLKRVAIVAHINPWAEIIAPAFANQFRALGGEVVFSERANPDEADFRTTIAKLRRAKPDGVYFPMVPMTSANFLKQVKEQGVDLPLLTGDPFLQDVIVRHQALLQRECIKQTTG